MSAGLESEGIYVQVNGVRFISEILLRIKQGRVLMSSEWIHVRVHLESVQRKQLSISRDKCLMR